METCMQEVYHGNQCSRDLHAQTTLIREERRQAEPPTMRSLGAGMALQCCFETRQGANWYSLIGFGHSWGEDRTLGELTLCPRGQFPERVFLDLRAVCCHYSSNE